MAVRLGRRVSPKLVWCVLITHGAAAAGAAGGPGQLATAPDDAAPATELVIDPGGPPLPMTPEVREGFLLRKAADYGVAPADYDRDGRVDLAVKLDGGTWHIDYAVNGFGRWDRSLWYPVGPGDTPVPADYDRDGRADPAVKGLDGVWRIDYTTDGYGPWNVERAGCGGRGARAVPADYDGDGRADLSVKDDAGVWSIDFAIDGFGAWDVTYTGRGGATFDPVPADYDRDGRADLAVKTDAGWWLVDYAVDGFGSWDLMRSGYGDALAHAVPADYDGDRRADMAVKTDDGRWFIDFAVNGFGSFDTVVSGAGGTTARAVPADYDGNGRADLGVRVDCGPWFIDHEANGFGAWNQRFDHMSANGVVTATSAARVVETLSSDFTGTIFIPSNTELDFTGWKELPVKSCVQFRGTRQQTDPGPLLYTNDQTEPYSLFTVFGHDVRFEGLRLRGPSNGDRSDTQPPVTAITVKVDAGLGLGLNVAVDRNEGWFWTHTPVYVEGLVPRVLSAEEVPPGTPFMTYAQGGLVRVTRNWLHHNSRNARGYGVNVGSGAYATIEGNVFSHNRHAIASNGYPHTGYIARYNYVLEGGYTEGGYWNQHFDAHGAGEGGYGAVAGERYEVVLNTFRGEQTYVLGFYTRAAFMLRGTPTVGAFFVANVLVHNGRDEAVRVKSPDCFVKVGGTGYYSDELCHLTVGPNSYDRDTSQDLAVGDFDGDGLEDVFLANGTAWWYSSAGRTEWRFLRPSPLRIAALRLGRFDSDAKTDVVYATGTEWLFSSGGTADPVLLKVGGTPLSRCVFGDFDGNGLTDALQANGWTWYLSRDARSRWSTIRSSTVTAANLRVGDFDGDGADEVLDVEDGKLSRWRLGWSDVYPMNDGLTSSVSGLVVGDFDGDGFDDVAQTSGSGWRYSRGGTTPWQDLRGSGGQPQYKEIREVLVGRFTRGDGDDALRYELVPYWVGSTRRYKLGVRFVGWDGTQDAFVQWSNEYVR